MDTVIASLALLVTAVPAVFIAASVILAAQRGQEIAPREPFAEKTTTSF